MFRKCKNRITSYNVCYTKLLRPAPLSADAVAAERARAHGIFRTWARPDLRGLFLEGGYLPFTDAAIAAREAWDPTTDDPVFRITSYNVCYTKLLRSRIYILA